jgi:hypothetical protein
MGGHCGTTSERIELEINDSDEPFNPYSIIGRVLLRKDPGPILETAVWREDAVAAWDCEAFSAQNINDATPSANNICDWRSATFKVTS